MPLLYYWRGDNYRRDLDFGAGFHLNQDNPALHEVAIGDSLWAFTRSATGRYALAAELVVRAKTHNPDRYRYGRYRIWGDLAQSRYFVVEGQPDIAPLIRVLSITARGEVLGRAFQGRAAVRQILARDDDLLREYASKLPIENRARLVPEERLEALVLAGDASKVAALIRDEPSGIAERRRRYLSVDAPRRGRHHVETLRRTYLGRCQLCRWSPRLDYGTDLCEAHHLHWLGRGGEDSLSNLVLLCPNHHRAVHGLDAPFDWKTNSFIFGATSEALALLEHSIEAV